MHRNTARVQLEILVSAGLLRRRAEQRWAAAVDERPLPVAPLSAGEAMDVLAEILDRLGFDPEPDDQGQRILLHQCPFADVARENRAVICGIHLGMLTGTAERLDAPLAVASLDPFAADDPLPCIVRLANRGEDSTAPARDGKQ